MFGILKLVVARGMVLLTITVLVIRWTISANINDAMYSFKYAVDQAHLGLLTHHFEERKGDIVRGSYSVLESDGRIRIVEYAVAGPTGFRAIVKYRRPPGQQLMGHLRFPHYYQKAIRLAEPVSFITADLFDARKSYPTLHL